MINCNSLFFNVLSAKLIIYNIIHHFPNLLYTCIYIAI